MARNNRIKSIIYDFLLRSGCLDLQTISLALNIDSNVAKRVINGMLKENLVTKIGTSNYYTVLPNSLGVFNNFKVIENNISTLIKQSKDGIESIEKTLTNISEEITSGVIDSLRSPIQNVLDTTTNIATDLDREAESLTSSMNSILNNLSQILNDIRFLSKSIDNINTNTATILATTLDKIGSGISGEINDFLSKLSESFLAVREYATSLISNYKAEINNAFDQTKNNIVQQLENVTKALDQMFNFLKSEISALRDNYNDLTIKLSGYISDLKDDLLEQVGVIANSLTKHSMDAINSIISDHINLVIGYLGHLRAKSGDELPVIKNNVLSKMENIRQSYSQLIQEFINGLYRSLDMHYKSISSHITEIKNVISDAKTNTENTTNSVINSYLSTIRHETNKTNETIFGLLENKLLPLTQGIIASAEGITNVSNLIKSTSKNLFSSLNSHASGVYQKISTDLEKVNNIISDKLATMEKNIDFGLKDFEKTFSIESFIDLLRNSLESAMSPMFDRLIGVLTDTIKGVFEDLKTMIREYLAPVSTQPQMTNTNPSNKDLIPKGNPDHNSSEAIDLNNNKEIFGLVEGKIEEKLKFLSTILSREINSIKKSMSNVILNATKTTLEKIRNDTINLISNTKTKIINDVIWLGSELGARVRIILDRTQSLINDFREIIQRNIENMDKQIVSFISSKTRDIIETGNALSSVINDIKNEATSSILSLIDSLDKEFKNSINTLRTSILTSIDRVLELTETLRSAIDANYNDLKNNIRDHSSLTSAKFGNSLDKYVTEVNQLIDEYRNSIDNMAKDITEKVTNLAPAILNQIEDTVSKIHSEAMDQLHASIDSTISRIESDYETGKSNILELIDSVYENINNRLQEQIKYSRSISNAVSEFLVGSIHKYQESTNSMEKNLVDKLAEFKETLTSSLLSRHKTSIETIESIINDCSESITKLLKPTVELISNLLNKIKDEIEEPYRNLSASISKLINNYRTRLSRLAESTEENMKTSFDLLRNYITEKTVVIRKAILDFSGKNEESLNNLLVDINSTKDQLLNSIGDFVKSVQSRPTSVFVFYGAEAVYAAIRSMISRASRSVSIITRVVDKPLCEIIKTIDPSILIEAYCSTYEETPPLNVSIIPLQGIPQSIILVSTDNDGLLLVVRNKTGEYIGVVFEDVPLDEFLRNLLK